MFVGRRPDGSIYGLWTVAQAHDSYHVGLEELPDDHPDVVEFQNQIAALFSFVQSGVKIPA